MLRLYLLAHAPTAAQRHFRFPADEGIEPIEPAVGRRLTAGLGSLTAAWRGPERRVAETVAALGLTASPCVELRAWSAGRWAGQAVDRIAEQDPAGFRAWRTDPDAAPHGGESLKTLIGRVGRWLETQPPPDGRALIVADSAVIRAAVVHVLGAGPETFWRLDVAPLSLSVVQRAGDGWRLRSLDVEFRAGQQTSRPADQS